MAGAQEMARRPLGLTHGFQSCDDVPVGHMDQFFQDAASMA